MNFNPNYLNMDTIERIKKEASDNAYLSIGHLPEHESDRICYISNYTEGAISERNRTIDEAVEIIRQNRSLETAEYEWIKNRLERLKIDLKG